MKTTTSIDAIILQTTPYKENDLIVHTYSLDYGKLSFVAKGVRKMNSKNAKGIQLMSLSHLEVSISNSLGTLKRAEALNYYRHISENLLSDAVGQCVLEYYYRYESQNEPDEVKFKLLVSALESLNNGYNPSLVLSLFLSQIIKNHGIFVNVDACNECDSKQVSGISHVDGHFVCANHIHLGHLYRVSTLKFYRRIFLLDYDSIDSFDENDVEIKSIIQIQSHLLNDYTGISFNTMKFIEKLL